MNIQAHCENQVCRPVQSHECDEHGISYEPCGPVYSLWEQIAGCEAVEVLGRIKDPKDGFRSLIRVHRVFDMGVEAFFSKLDFAVSCDAREIFGFPEIWWNPDRPKKAKARIGGAV